MDDIKLFRKVNKDGDKQHLQNDLDKLVKWSEKWQLLGNVNAYTTCHPKQQVLDGKWTRKPLAAYQKSSNFIIYV